MKSLTIIAFLAISFNCNAQNIDSLMIEYENTLPMTFQQVPCPEGRLGCTILHWEQVKQHPTYEGFTKWLKQKDNHRKLAPIGEPIKNFGVLLDTVSLKYIEHRHNAIGR